MATNTEQVSYPRHVQGNVDAATAMGHAVVSQGCGMFRCTRCEVRGYLDEGPDKRLIEQSCAPSPALAAVPAYRRTSALYQRTRPRSPRRTAEVTTYRRANGSQASVAKPRRSVRAKVYPRAHTPSQAARQRANAAARVARSNDAMIARGEWL